MPLFDLEKIADQIAITKLAIAVLEKDPENKDTDKKNLKEQVMSLFYCLTISQYIDRKDPVETDQLKEYHPSHIKGVLYPNESILSYITQNPKEIWVTRNGIDREVCIDLIFKTIHGALYISMELERYKRVQLSFTRSTLQDSADNILRIHHQKQTTINVAGLFCNFIGVPVYYPIGNPEITTPIKETIKKIHQFLTKQEIIQRGWLTRTTDFWKIWDLAKPGWDTNL